MVGVARIISYLFSEDIVLIESFPGRGITLFIFSILLSLGLIACQNNPNPTPFPTVLVPTSTPVPSTATNTPIPLITYTHSEAGFALDLPATWSVADRGITPLGWHFLLGPDPSEPGPTSSALFVAPAGTLTIESAARALLCGDCTDDIAFEETSLGGRPAQSTLIANEGLPTLTWYFVEVDERLYFFSIHDPVSLADRVDLLETIIFSEPIIPTATPTVTPTPLPTATPIPQLAIDPVNAWRGVEVEQVGILFEVPANWTQVEDTLEWQPEGVAPAGLGFIGRSGELDTDPATLLPDSDGLVRSAELELAWATGISYTIQLEGTWERHVVIPAGTQILDFYTSGLTQQALTALNPVLQHTLDSVELGFVIETYLEEPTDDVAVPFYQALVNDPAGDTALLYLTQDLRNTLTSRQTPLDLLDLPGRLVAYNIEWTFSSATLIILETTISLENGDTALRELVILFSDELGWRINEINNLDDEATDG